MGGDTMPFLRSCASHTVPLLPQLAKVLGGSADQLLGMEKEKANGRVRDSRLWRRFSQVEKLPPAQRKPIIQLLDAFLQGTPPKRG